MKCVLYYYYYYTTCVMVLDRKQNKALRVIHQQGFFGRHRSKFINFVTGYSNLLVVIAAAVNDLSECQMMNWMTLLEFY